MNIEVDVARDMAVSGGHFTTRVPVLTACPACGARPLERVVCSMCDRSGELLIHVRATLRLPRHLRDGDRVRLDCYLELFGHRSVWAQIRVV